MDLSSTNVLKIGLCTLFYKINLYQIENSKNVRRAFHNVMFKIAKQTSVKKKENYHGGKLRLLQRVVVHKENIDGEIGPIELAKSSV